MKHLLLIPLALLLLAFPSLSLAQPNAETAAQPDSQRDLAEAARDYQQANAIWGDGKSPEAEALLKSSLAILERTKGPKTQEAGLVLERLGALDYNRKEYARAETLFRQALDIDEAMLGERNMTTSIALGDVGAAIRQQERYAEAEPYVQRSLAIRRALLPPNSQPIASSLENLARIHFGEHEYSDARSAVVEKLRIDQTAATPDSKVVDYDQELLREIDGAATLRRNHRYAGAVAVLSLLLLAGLTVRAEKQARSGAGQSPNFAVFSLNAIASVGAYGGLGYLGAFAFEWFLVSVLPPAVVNDTPSGVGKVGLLLGLWGASILVQLLTNAMRQAAGLPMRRISFFPRHAPTPPPINPIDNVGDTGMPWFAAMEYYALILNRAYKVFITPTFLAGAEVRNMMASPPGVTPAMQSQDYWVNTRAAAVYQGMDPTSAAFLAVKPSNFQIAWTEIAEVTYLPGRKWGMGNVPHSGRILLRLKSGKKRELILLGVQNGEALTALLRRKIDGEPARAAG